MKRNVPAALALVAFVSFSGDLTAQQIFQGPAGGGPFPGGPFPGGPPAAGPPRDTRPAVVGTAVIRGKVVAADSGRPLRRARVLVTAPELGPGDTRSTSTAVDGTF